MPETVATFQSTAVRTASADAPFVREAARLAADGELGNSDAIHLLHLPHTPDDVEVVLTAFDGQLSREARSKLTLEAFVPRPTGVDNQRFEPFFDKYTVSGATYRTASGAVIPNELVYFNGQMVQLYGECTNVRPVEEALAGSGWRPLTVRQEDGREVAIGQLWCSRFTDSTIGAYGAMFIVVVVVPEDGASTASLRAGGDATAALPMMDGAFDESNRRYENRGRLFLYRLLDTTQVAIDVGRERMGTDKRPGDVQVLVEEQEVRLSVSDNVGRGVASARVVRTDTASFLPDLQRAAASAGKTLRQYPAGTEYIYPSVARIGRGPMVAWEWRTDVVPHLQGVPSNAVNIDAASDEGRILVEWGFTPRVMACTAHVRGVVTGLGDGSVAPRGATRVHRLRPADSAGLVERGFLPRFNAATRGPSDGRTSGGAAAGIAGPQWAWNTTYLGTLTATLRKESVGVTPDGLRINWHVIEGRFAGPGFESRVLPGAADWMRIRPDGIGIVNVHACFETSAGARVYGSYAGHFDLGPDGYARAMRDDYDTLPPVVVTPTYATADPALAWLNRVQCIGVGRVEMKAFRVQFDVYVVRVGDKSRSSDEHDSSLYARMGGDEVIAPMASEFIDWIVIDDRLKRLFGTHYTEAQFKAIRRHVVEFLCQITGGPCVYTGRDMKTTHRGLGITDDDWVTAADLLTAALDKYRVPAPEQVEFMRIVTSLKGDIVESL